MKPYKPLFTESSEEEIYHAAVQYGSKSLKDDEETVLFKWVKPGSQFRFDTSDKWYTKRNNSGWYTDPDIPQHKFKTGVNTGVIIKKSLNEELHVFKAKEMVAKSFAQKIYKADSRRFHQIATGNGMYDSQSKSLTPEGIKSLKGMISSYIWTTLDMGANIAAQSVQNLTDDDVNVIFQNTKEYANKVNWRDF